MRNKQYVNGNTYELSHVNEARAIVKELGIRSHGFGPLLKKVEDEGLYVKNKRTLVKDGFELTLYDQEYMDFSFSHGLSDPQWGLYVKFQKI